MTKKEAKPKEPEARDQCTSKHNLKRKTECTRFS